MTTSERFTPYLSAIRLLAHLTPERLTDPLRLLQQWIVIYLGLAYTQLPVVSFTREAIQSTV